MFVWFPVLSCLLQ